MHPPYIEGVIFEPAIAHSHLSKLPADAHIKHLISFQHLVNSNINHGDFFNSFLELWKAATVEIMHIDWNEDTYIIICNCAPAQNMNRHSVSEATAAMTMRLP
jgi:hypothetical protein